MGMFSFDDQYKMFGATPVDNQFLLEYMPASPENFVKVYLYGLTQCFYPQETMTVERMARDLHLQEEDVLSAYRYWERRGLVQRVADNPPLWRYMSLNQRVFSGVPVTDEAYDAFAAAVYALFGSARDVHGAEIARAYEWVEVMGLPQEVVLAFLKFKKNTSGPHFSFSAAEKQATELAAEGVRTAEDAEAFLTRDKKLYEECRKVLKTLGKRRGDPSEPELAFYRKWTQEWGYSLEAILAACRETTKGEPTFAYLDGILEGMRRRNDGKAATSAEAVLRQQEAETQRAAPLKRLLNALGLRTAVSEGTLAVYDDLKAQCPDEAVILAAGRFCAEQQQGDLASVAQVLRVWKAQGVASPEDAEAFIRRFRRAEETARAIYADLGIRSNPTKKDRETVQSWLEDLKLDNQMILFCAQYAQGAKQPIAYLNAILRKYVEKGITTAEAAAADHEAFQAQRQQEAQNEPPAADSRQARAGKKLNAQYEDQRSYQPGMVVPDWLKQEIEEMRRNGELDSSGSGS